MNDAEKVGKAADEIRAILMRLEADTGRTVASLELNWLDMTTHDSPPQVAKQVVILLNTESGWL